MAKHINILLNGLNAFLLAIMLTILGAPTAMAQDAGVGTRAWVNKQYEIKGSWEIVELAGQTVIRFDNTFETKKGPDLKLFLSKQTISQVTGKTATLDGFFLGELKNNKGAQEYIVPDGINLDDFASLLIHCEEFAVLWGGGSL